MSIFQKYKKAIHRNILGDKEDAEDTLQDAQNKLFVDTISFIIPLSLIALIPALYISWVNDLLIVATLDTLSLFIIILIAFVKGISLVIRKFLFIACVYFISAFLLLYVGGHGPGLIFMYAACIFGLIILSQKYAWWWTITNTAICLLFIFVLHFNLSPINEVNNTSIVEWIAISTNLIFLSALSSAMLPKLFSKLSATINKQNELQISLEEKTKILEKSLLLLKHKNEDLEQFAYVASHDLQEPLRMISGFLTKLEQKYENQLDDKAQKYIHFAVDGAKRMRQIILDLLDFSRIGMQENGLTTVDTNHIISEISSLLKSQIEEKKATIIYDNLPVIKSYPILLSQLFQNLIENSLKYCKEDVTPQIEIKVIEQKKEWLFSVQDNGIGIDGEHFEKIFVIFQRLHNNEEYSGTGIGLAIVKKIIDTLDGKIWLESEPGIGSTFYFTLKKHRI